MSDFRLSRDLTRYINGRPCPTFREVHTRLREFRRVQRIAHPSSKVTRDAAKWAYWLAFDDLQERAK